MAKKDASSARWGAHSSKRGTLIEGESLRKRSLCTYVGGGDSSSGRFGGRCGIQMPAGCSNERWRAAACWPAMRCAVASSIAPICTLRRSSSGSASSVAESFCGGGRCGRCCCCCGGGTRCAPPVGLTE